jgi:glutamine synthetase
MKYSHRLTIDFCTFLFEGDMAVNVETQRRSVDDEIHALIDVLRHRGMTSIVGTFIDSARVARAKQVHLDRMRALHVHGLGASYSWAVFATDDALPLTARFSTVGDMRKRAELSSLRVLDDHVAWVPLDIFDQDGTAFEHCPRNILRQLQAQPDEAGYSALDACEIEFTWFDEASGEIGGGPAYGLRAMMNGKVFFSDIISSLNRAGLDIEQIQAEAGLGQIEISTPPTGPLDAAVTLVLARLILCRVARGYGKRRSFAPQLLEEGIGNGAHLRFSLQKDSVPILSRGRGPRGLTPDGEHAIAGILQWLQESLGILAPSLLLLLLSSYRLQPGEWSGASLCWGFENREAALRVCKATSGNPHGANLEVEVTDHTMKPYAAVALVFGLAQKDMNEESPLPDEAPNDPSLLDHEELARRGIGPLDVDQACNLEKTVASSTVREILGEEVLESVKAISGHEVERAATATPGDLIRESQFAWSS